MASSSTQQKRCFTHLNGRSPATGDVAVLQLLRAPSSPSLFFLRSGAGTYWLKGTAVRGSLTDARRADMSSLRTSGIFRWGAPSDSESLPRPAEERWGGKGHIWLFRLVSSQLIEARCLGSGSEPRSAAARCSPQRHVILSLRVA
ncbi:hypothetical protein EYF80_011026 [Liparis tanakae]|uniref:Uncharacterized protein n=1 Tax=Liparis tanakae TaxID=230148 RepID=A0A4Z2ILS8_9TELE|nr:hypothetical protein EYF80_011026 [Liparis tanakae]